MIYFSNGNAAHRVHGPMDYGRAWSTGPWWTTGGSSRKAHWSPALRPLRWVGAHRELGETERRSRGSSPWVRVGGGGRAFGAEGEKREAGGAVGEVAGVSVPFIGPEARERRRSVRELGRQPLMVPFRAGGGNGEGKRGAGEVKGAVVTIHYAMGGEGCCSGEARWLPKARGVAVPTGTATAAG
jgi:hypothetical protein